jgi:small conductance mechanosensitive channel
MAVAELGDSSVNIAVRVWVNASDYGKVKFKMNEEVYRTFDSEGLSIPNPQLDIHIQQTNAN